MDKYLIEGRNLKPKPLTIAQIRKFWQLNKYKDKEEIDAKWETKKAEHIKYWSAIYKDKKVISYPKLKLAWKIDINSNKAKIAYKQIDWVEPCICHTTKQNLLKKIQDICHYNYCQFEPNYNYTDNKGFIIFLSLPELIG